MPYRALVVFLHEKATGTIAHESFVSMPYRALVVFLPEFDEAEMREFLRFNALSSISCISTRT